jgi:hypothetical protein
VRFFTYFNGFLLVQELGKPVKASPLSAKPRLRFNHAALQLDFNINTRRQVQLHQGINGFGRRLINVDNPAMSPCFKVFP